MTTPNTIHDPVAISQGHQAAMANILAGAPITPGIPTPDPAEQHRRRQLAGARIDQHRLPGWFRRRLADNYRAAAADRTFPWRPAKCAEGIRRQLREMGVIQPGDHLGTHHRQQRVAVWRRDGGPITSAEASTLAAVLGLGPRSWLRVAGLRAVVMAEGGDLLDQVAGGTDRVD